MANVLSCSTYSKPENNISTRIKLCAKCRITKYCSREYEKINSKVHKKVYRGNAVARAETTTRAAIASSASASTSISGLNTSSDNAATTLKGLKRTIDKPFYKLESRTWLHNRSERDLYKVYY
ncbi:hypothetical protein K432DRAFT_411726 [Lepidopterella palustris CBS 459.81]|uniref:MYND-type domain-containing protein n=1 Tax=Lepidopterella palustris CBS 459.81 TaxID=1314670 RepID=A0A8E2DW83_9PEZI|nr:hypothetical protein K432DRAFT_411726 [Lepidopterella palustris CBS 459.81]